MTQQSVEILIGKLITDAAGAADGATTTVHVRGHFRSMTVDELRTEAKPEPSTDDAPVATRT